MRVCKVEGCEAEKFAKKLCMKHYFRLRRYGRLHTVRDGDWRPYRHGVVRICSLPGCTERHYGRDLCYRHWKQAWRMRRNDRDQRSRVPVEPLRESLEDAIERRGFNATAERLGLNPKHLRKILTETERINLDTADRICIHLGLPFDALFNQEVA